MIFNEKFFSGQREVRANIRVRFNAKLNLSRVPTLARKASRLFETKRLETRVLGFTRLTLLSFLSELSLYYLTHVPHPFLDSRQIVLSTYKCHSRMTFVTKYSIFLKIILFTFLLKYVAIFFVINIILVSDNKYYFFL